jgi:hypothetical protein
MYLLIDLLMYLLIDLLMYLLIDLLMYLLIDLLMYLLIDVLMFVCHEDLITEMEPSLSVYVPICFICSSCVYLLCSLMCDWVRKPAFSAVLSFKTAACFNRDQCATLNLTFSIGVLRLKCRC